MIRCRGRGFVYRPSDGRSVNCPGFKLLVYEIKLKKRRAAGAYDGIGEIIGMPGRSRAGSPLPIVVDCHTGELHCGECETGRDDD